MVSKHTDPRAGSNRLKTAFWLLTTALLGLPLVTPLLRWTSVPCTHDGHLHYHRVAAMAHAWAEGIYLTRWLPDLAFGYGYPFFVYREAAPLYAVLLPHLAGLPLPAASNLFYAITILLCGLFMFLWARDLFGERAALVSAVAYMAAPYILIDALIRGNSPESLALPLFPFLLWAGRRWVLTGAVPAFIAGALGLALLSVGHNISTFIFAPTLAVYLGVLAVGAGRGQQTAEDRPRKTGGDRLFRVVALLGLGLGLAFFYTGGALLEMDQVTLEMSTTTRNNDWRFNFASLAEIASPVAAEDPSLVNPPLLFRLGWMPLLLAAAGLTGLAWIRGNDPRAREQRLHIWLMAAATAVYLFMSLPISRPLWDALPLIDFVQFPWRFVGRAALPVAFLAGVPFYYFESRQPAAPKELHATETGPKPEGSESPVMRRWSPAILTAVAIVLLMIEAIPNLYPRICVEEPFPTILTVHEYERVTGLVGVDPEGSYFPRTVRQRPTGSPLEADYLAGRAPQRFDASALPSAATISAITDEPLGVTLTVNSPVPFTARYLSFAFPGWSARVNGRSVPIIPEDPSGLITFEVPSGTQVISVKWGATPLRLALVGASALSAAGLLAVAVWVRRQQTAVSGRGQGTRRRSGAGWREMAGLALLGLGLLAFKAVIVDRVDNPLRQPGGPPERASSTTDRVQSAELRLEDVVPAGARVAAGETFEVDMAWRAIAPPPADYQTELWLEDDNGLVWSEKGTERPRVYEDAPPTRLWSSGEWGWDSREVRVLAGTPPGTYHLVMTLFDKATLQPVTLYDAGTGAVVGPTARIGQVSVENPAVPLPLMPQYPMDADLAGSALRLRGYNQDRALAAPGDPVLLTLFWSCMEPQSCGRVRLQLHNESGMVVEEWDIPAVREGVGTDDWPANGFLRGQRLLQVPRDLASGRYSFRLNGDIRLGTLDVVAPERRFSPPALALAFDAPFSTPDGEVVATLVGLTTSTEPLPCPPAPSRSCPISLVWRAESEAETNYHVFVHLVDEAGSLVAQSDTVPADWTRPTTGWLPGEYITDNHALSLPDELPGSPLTIRIGLYDPDTGRRLLTGDGDFVALEFPAAP